MRWTLYLTENYRVVWGFDGIDMPNVPGQKSLLASGMGDAAKKSPKTNEPK
ncbi:MAG: hypothetical protein WC069_06245 [Candidatus Shapirobacteria bacterium]